MVERKIFDKDTSIDAIDEFIKDNPGHNFITNVKISNQLQDKAGFTGYVHPESYNEHPIRQDGIMYGKNIYVWPMISIDDWSVYVVDDKFIEKFSRNPVEFLRYCGIEPDDYETHIDLSKAVKKVFGVEIKLNTENLGGHVLDDEIKGLLKKALITETMHFIFKSEMQQYAES